MNFDTSKHANDRQLQVLLFEQEDSVESIEISRHVELCETCQIRLTEMVNSAAIETETSLLLSGYSESDRSLPFDSDSSKAEIETSEEEFDHFLLQPPSHPEMLGRIGRYEIERRIGSGGMGVVFKAIDTELNRPVAVKVLAPHLARNGAARQRFSRESRAAAAVVHENVVAIHNVDSSAEYPYLVMQYVAGESLQSRIDREGPLDTERILRIGIQAAFGLAAAHQQGIVHRDIKPANFLLEHGVDRLLITDFGLARTVDDASLTHTGVVAGTPNYMSPEQASGDEVDHRTDLFSLGSVLYFVATGHPPFRAERAMGVLHRICSEKHRPVWQVNSAIPDELCEIIDRLLEKRPLKRFPNATLLADSMSRLLQRIQSRQPRLSTRLKSWVRRNRSMAGLTVCALSVAAAIAVWSNIESGSFAKLFSYATGNNASTSSKITPTESAELSNMSKPQDASHNRTDGSSLPESKTASNPVSLFSEDRLEFDRSLDSVRSSLSNLESFTATPASDSFGEFQADLNSVQHKLRSIDPNLK